MCLTQLYDTHCSVLTGGPDGLVIRHLSTEQERLKVLSLGRGLE